MANVIYVINKDGKPLMPTTRRGHVGYLLRKKQARVVKHNPFTVQLSYETPDKVQELTLGIDPGRTNIGIAVVDETGECVFSAHVETRNKDVPKLMAKRKVHRQARRHYGRRVKRQRRAKANGTVNENGIITRVLPQTETPIECKLIKNKEARFCNREREPGWLTPTANQLLLTHLNLVTKIEQILPISKIALEINKFAFMELDDHNIRPWEYQHGPLFGFESRDDAVYALQEGKCLLCGKPLIEHYHHVIPKHEHGSDTIANIVGLCSGCHDLVHRDARAKDKLAKVHAGAKKKYAGTSVLNQIMPKLITRLASKDEDFTLVSAKEISFIRRSSALPKDHHIDAYCIAMSVVDGESHMNGMLRKPYQVMQFRRHDRQARHQAMVDRKYYLNGKHVATNRHKRFEQKGDSLEEFLQKNPGVRPEMLAVREHKPVYKRMNRIAPGTLMRCKNDVFVYKTGTPITNGTPFYAVDTEGQRHKYRLSKPVLHNTGIVVLGNRGGYPPQILGTHDKKRE